jgi:hypothetical protein
MGETSQLLGNGFILGVHVEQITHRSAMGVRDILNGYRAPTGLTICELWRGWRCRAGTIFLRPIFFKR